MTEDEIIAFINASGEKATEGTNALTDLENTAALVSSVDFEVMLGGFAGFYTNSAGDYASETVDALRSIGAEATAEAVRKTLRLCPDREMAVHRDYRATYIADLWQGFRDGEAEYESQNPSIWELLTYHIKSAHTVMNTETSPQ